MSPQQLPIACTLTPADGRTRTARWQGLLATEPAVEREPRELTLRFGADVATELAALAAAEQECCGFVHWHANGTVLRVTGEPDQVDAIAALLS